MLYRPTQGQSRAAPMPEPASSRSSRADPFSITRWSLVAAAAEARLPLTELCLHYWYPVYAQARRQGHAPEAAQRLTRAFFDQLVGERLQQVRADPPPRFRSWLQGELARFLAQPPPGTETDASAVLPPLPVDLLERRLQEDSAPGEGIERGFDRRFALEVLGRAANRLRREAQQAGRETLFAALAPYLLSDPPAAVYARLAAELGAQTLGLVVALKRLRQRYRELVDDELAQTVRSAADLEAERAALHAALQPHG